MSGCGSLSPLGCLVRANKSQGVGGGAARSEVDSLAEPLKRLVARQVKAKSWLSTALAIEGFPSPNLTDKSKTRFLNTVIRYILVISHQLVRRVLMDRLV